MSKHTPLVSMAGIATVAMTALLCGCSDGTPSVEKVEARKITPNPDLVAPGPPKVGAGQTAMPGQPAPN